MSDQHDNASTIITITASALLPPHTRDGCRKCQCEHGYLARYIKSSGATAIRWVCEWCEDYGTAGDLPRSVLGTVPLAMLPLRVNRVEEERHPECVVCGTTAVEYHHWAPRAIFTDWPDVGVYLCQHHHTDWHTRMRAHGLRWPHELPDAA